jgi:hypothetical protein
MYARGGMMMADHYSSERVPVMKSYMDLAIVIRSLPNRNLSEACGSRDNILKTVFAARRRTTLPYRPPPEPRSHSQEKECPVCRHP